MNPSPWDLTSKPRGRPPGTMRLWAWRTASQRRSPRLSLAAVEPSMSEKRSVTVPSGEAWGGSRAAPGGGRGGQIDGGLDALAPAMPWRRACRSAPALPSGPPRRDGGRISRDPAASRRPRPVAGVQMGAAEAVEDLRLVPGQGGAAGGPARAFLNPARPPRSASSAARVAASARATRPAAPRQSSPPQRISRASGHVRAASPGRPAWAKGGRAPPVPPAPSRTWAPSTVVGSTSSAATRRRGGRPQAFERRQEGGPDRPPIFFSVAPARASSACRPQRAGLSQGPSTKARKEM